MSGREARTFAAARAARRAVQAQGPWVTYLACPPERVRIPLGPELLEALRPRAHRKPNGDPLFWDFFTLTPEGYRLEVLKQGAPAAAVRPVFWAMIRPEGAVELARPVGSRLFTPGRLALGSHGVALEAMGLFAFCAWLYRQAGYRGPVRAGCVADRVAGLLLDPHPDGEVAEWTLRSETCTCEVSCGPAGLGAGAVRLVAEFLDALYREAAGCACPHFQAGGSLARMAAEAPSGEE